MPAGLETQTACCPSSPALQFSRPPEVSTALPQAVQKVVPQCHQSVSVLSLLKPSNKCAQQIISPEPLGGPKPGTVCLLLVPQLPPLCLCICCCRYQRKSIPILLQVFITQNPNPRGLHDSFFCPSSPFMSGCQPAHPAASHLPGKGE